MKIPIPDDTTFLASLRWTGALRLRVEEIAPTDAAATVSAEGLDSMVGLLRTVENNLPEGSGNAEVLSVLNSIKVDHRRNRAVVTATLPESLLQQLAAAPGNAAVPAESATPA